MFLFLNLLSMQNRIDPYINKSESPKRKENETNHHIMPRSRASYVAPEAQVRLFVSIHEALHRLYGNATPAEQIMKTLRINKPIRTDKFTKELYQMLNEDDYIYKA